MAYTAIDKSGSHMSVKAYTGNGSSLSVTGVGHQPDLVWLKNLEAANDHQWQDSVRGKSGSNYQYIQCNNANAQSVQGDSDGVNTLGSDGFTVGYNDSGAWNESGTEYISYNWKAGTTSGISTDGETDITPSAYSFNATSGVSIVKYTGTGTSGEGVPHGLGAKPQFIIVKRTDTSGAWTVFTQPILNTSNATKFFEMHNTDAESTNNNRWNGWQPDTVNFYIGNASEVNASGGTYVAYVFANKAGFSKLGTYTGNGSSDGPFCYTGFKPSWVLQKNMSATQGWQLQDDKREGYNGSNKLLQPNDNAAESDVNRIHILSNGFKVITTDAGQNTSGSNYVYMAFGQSIVGSNNVPATAK